MLRAARTRARAARLRLGQEREDPAAVVVDAARSWPTGRGAWPRRSALRSWRNETSPTTRATGPSATAAEPSAVETTPSMPLAPRLERTVIALVGGREPGVEVADGHRAAGPQDGAVRQRIGEHGHGGTLEGLGQRRRASAPSPRPRSARRPASRAVQLGPAARLGASSGARRAPRAVAAASAWTKVVGSSAGSRQPPSPSSTISSGRARSSSWRIGLDVGMAPGAEDEVRRVGVDPGARARRAGRARVITSARSCGPVRRPESGSARIGKPVARASAASAAGSAGSSSGPAMIRPRRGRPRAARRAVERARRPASGGPAIARDEGRRGASAPSAGASGPSGSSGSRNGTLTCTGPAGPAAAMATARPATQRQWASVAGGPVEQRQLRVPLRGAPVEVRLVDRLRRAAVPELRRPVGGEHHQRHAGELRLDHGRRELDHGRAGRRQQDHGPPRRPGHAQREEARPPARRSRTRTRRPGAVRSASARGVDREPGQTTASRTPAATSSSTKARRPAASLIARPPGCPGRRSPRAA